MGWKWGLVLGLVLIAAVEWWARSFYPILLDRLYVWDPDLGMVPKPSAEGKIATPRGARFHFKHDAHGMRVTSLKRTPCEHPWLLLGDSNVYGVGVEEQDTLASQVERKYPHCCTVNAGAPGRGPDYYLRFLQLRGNLISPEKVAVFFTGHNDWKDAYEQTLFESLDSLKPKRPSPPEWHLRYSIRSLRITEKLVTELYGRWLERRAQKLQLPNPSEDQRRAADVFLHAIESTAKAQHWDLHFFFLPSPSDVDLARLGRESSTRIAFHSLFQSKTPQTDLTKVLADSALSTDALFIPHDGHISAQGNELLATAVAQVLKNHL